MLAKCLSKKIGKKIDQKKTTKKIDIPNAASPGALDAYIGSTRPQGTGSASVRAKSLTKKKSPNLGWVQIESGLG